MLRNLRNILNSRMLVSKRVTPLLKIRHNHFSYLNHNTNKHFLFKLPQRGISINRSKDHLQITPLINEGYSSKPVSWWLFLTSGMVLFMICVGGYTRLTKSGLSMTRWKPIGYRYPKSEEEWNEEFDLYKQYPEYQLATEEVTLSMFKRIFFIEYFHRLIGNVLGFTFGLPFIYFTSRGYFTSLMKKRMFGLLLFGGFQGLIGWWMVKSGFNKKPDYQSRPRVSTYRLLVHNSFAVLIYGVLSYHAIVLSKFAKYSPSPAQMTNLVKSRKAAILLIHLVAFNLLSGVTVAGIDAGKVFNTWPLMNGKFIPDGYWKPNLQIKNFFENYANTQFNHRTFAYITYIASLVMFFRFRKAGLPNKVKWGFNSVFATVHLQVLNGILMLKEQVPVEKGVAHQLNGMIVLSSVVYLLAITSGRCII